MRKFALIIFAALALSSCVVDANMDSSHTDSYFKSFSSDLIRNNISPIVESLLYKSSKEDIDINAEGYQCLIAIGEDKVVSVERIADRTWSAKTENSTLSLEINIYRENNDKLSGWICKDLSLNYNEGNGYTAQIISLKPMTYSWEYNWSSYQLQLSSAEFIVSTFQDGNPKDSRKLACIEGDYQLL